MHIACALWLEVRQFLIAPGLVNSRTGFGQSPEVRTQDAAPIFLDCEYWEVRTKSRRETNDTQIGHPHAVTNTTTSRPALLRPVSINSIALKVKNKNAIVT